MTNETNIQDVAKQVLAKRDITKQDLDRWARGDWALILGASSGFGEACALSLAAAGFNIAGVHLDRRAGLEHVAQIKQKIADLGAKALFFNVNASDADKRAEVLTALAAKVNDGDTNADVSSGGAQVRVLIHSLAFGTLKPFFDETEKSSINHKAMNMTLDVMAHSLVYWAQDIVRRKLMRRGGRVFAMTSAGSRVMWPAYGAVSAAKSTLESHCRQIAVELGKEGITANAIMAGVTDTPALRKIPGNEAMIEGSLRTHPVGRLTTPKDVADVIALLARPESQWMTGNVIHVDGGEIIAG